MSEIGGSAHFSGFFESLVHAHTPTSPFFPNQPLILDRRVPNVSGATRSPESARPLSEDAAAVAGLLRLHRAGFRVEGMPCFAAGRMEGGDGNHSGCADACGVRPKLHVHHERRRCALNVQIIRGDEHGHLPSFLHLCRVAVIDAEQEEK